MALDWPTPPECYEVQDSAPKLSNGAQQGNMVRMTTMPSSNSVQTDHDNWI